MQSLQQGGLVSRYEICMSQSLLLLRRFSHQCCVLNSHFYACRFQFPCSSSPACWSHSSAYIWVHVAAFTSLLRVSTNVLEYVGFHVPLYPGRCYSSSGCRTLQKWTCARFKVHKCLVAHCILIYLTQMPFIRFHFVINAYIFLKYIYIYFEKMREIDCMFTALVSHPHMVLIMY